MAEKEKKGDNLASFLKMFTEPTEQPFHKAHGSTDRIEERGDLDHHGSGHSMFLEVGTRKPSLLLITGQITVD